MSDQKNNTFLKQNTLLHKDTEEPLDSSYLADKLPKELYRVMAPFFNAAELYNIYGVLLRAKVAVDRSILVEDNEQAYIKAFKSVVYSYKAGRVRSLHGCLYTAWKAVTHSVKFRKNGLLDAMMQVMQ
jgi:hypothetical protein